MCPVVTLAQVERCGIGWKRLESAKGPSPVATGCPCPSGGCVSVGDHVSDMDEHTHALAHSTATPERGGGRGLESHSCLRVDTAALAVRTLRARSPVGRLGAREQECSPPPTPQSDRGRRVGKLASASGMRDPGHVRAGLRWMVHGDAPGQLLVRRRPSLHDHRRASGHGPRLLRHQVLAEGARQLEEPGDDAAQDDDEADGGHIDVVCVVRDAIRGAIR